MTQTVDSVSFRARVKSSDAQWARTLRWLFYGVRYWQMPSVRWIHKPVWWMHHVFLSLARNLMQQLYFSPVFRSRLRRAPQRLHLYSGMPQVGGRLAIDIGENCRISGISSLFGRGSAVQVPELIVGDNVDLGWQCTIAVGQRVVLGDHVRLAGRCYLAGFPGHPEDPVARANGLPETDDQVGDIVLHDNVWLATGVTVLAGVTVGENSIIGAGSVVTRDIPANVIAAGVPAKVIRPVRVADRGQ